ncbi:DeoR/GlpR transcriptional regulator [Lachnospiraceae bacterium MD1]|uniref:DeoR/GlpR transcriptional regulator n=1 Tax=Variimorphobacter saccharofermentans TaxID=2755051 RepID=A0A839K5J8_9FIRM|nr:DeoR/GlpR family DNA-binding transcription regulator [Variimorphobacter saccharofermentans]MBB2183941.1 DeoR/GlpR transcriptional regulator [Variimorphobacter saccharofermentans]
MFAIERIRIIKNYLVKDHKVSVAKLSELLNVTEVTIRRDLEKLESEGFLKRTHGGAVLIEQDDESLLDDSDEIQDVLLYQEIADTAFHLVNDGDAIMLINGTVNAYIAKALANHNNLTVVTNDIQIAAAFSHSPTNNLILLGGDLEENAVFGQITIDNLKNFSFNHIFIEIDGLSESVGVTVSSTKKATLIHQAVKLAESVTVVCLSRYFGTNALYRVGKINIAHRVLTDSNLEDKHKNYIYNCNIPLFTSVDVYEN